MAAEVCRRRAERARPHRGRLLLAAAVLTLLCGCSDTDAPAYTTQFSAFGSTIGLSIVGVSQARAAEAAADIERDFLFFERTLVPSGDESAMRRVNTLLAAGEPFAAPPSLLPLLRRAQALAEQSGHLFDPAAGGLTRLWGFEAATELRPQPPSRKAIRALLDAAPRIDAIRINGILLRSDNPAVELDLSGVAIAHAMDTAMETLRCRGVRSAMINADGQIRVIGNRSGRPWRIPVPRASGSGVIGIVDVGGDDGALFSVSAEQGAFRHDSRRYHNVIDPRTGRPARGARAASVLHLGDATTAAAAARALMIAGVEDWRTVAERMGMRDAMLIAPDGTLHLTPSMAARLELLDRNLEVAAGAGNESATPEKPPR